MPSSTLRARTRCLPRTPGVDERRRQNESMSSLTNPDNESMRDEGALEGKRREFAALAHVLIDLELALSTLQQELAGFRAEYLRIVGTSYAVLDETRARIAESRATGYAEDEAVQEAARRARQQAESSATRAEDLTSLEQGQSGDSPEALQSLFRAVALKLHPDLAATEDERAVRGPWMEKLDAAYRKRDAEAVEDLRTEWEANRQPAHGPEVAGDLVRAWLHGELTSGEYADQTRISSEVMQLTRQIGHAKQRIDDIQRMVDDLKASAVHKLYRAHAARLDSGASLLDEMTAKLDVQIADAEHEGPGAGRPRVLEPHDSSDLFARGLADLDRWRRIEGRTQQNGDGEPTATPRREKEARYEISMEQWDQVRPVLDRVFLAVRRELRPGRSLAREFVKVVKKALVKDAGLPKSAAREACVRWNRETRGGRDVEAAETDPDQSGPGTPGPAAAGGTSVDGTMGAGGAAAVPSTREGRYGAEDGSQGSGAVRADGTGTPSTEPRNDADGGRPAHQARAVADPQGPVVVSETDPRGDAAIGTEDYFNRGRRADQDRKHGDASRWHRLAAERGHAEAQYHLGLMYLNGRGVRRAYDAGARWLREAADQGHALAQRNLAVLYFKGEGVPRDHVATVEWLNRSAVQGCVSAQMDLARVYLEGDGVQNPAAAVTWLQLLAEGGHREEQYYLGRMYSDGRGVSRDPVVAATWFRRAADQRHHEAEYRLGLIYRDGAGVPQDFGNAAGWLRRAAASQHAKARFVRDRLYRTGKLMPLEPEEQFQLADGYFTGYDIPQDHDAAAMWFLRAASQGHTEAAYRLGDMHFRGQGLPQDCAEAAKWLRRAAERGHSLAQRDLAALCFYGRGVPRDHNAAAMWLRRATEAERVLYRTEGTTTGQRRLW